MMAKDQPGQNNWNKTYTDKNMVQHTQVHEIIRNSDKRRVINRWQVTMSMEMRNMAQQQQST